MNLRTKLVAGLAAVAISGVLAHAAGMFQGYPIVGGPSYCDGASTAGVPGTAAVCNVTVPAGPPAVTGNELIPADTNLSQGQAPQTVLIPQGVFAQHGQGGFRNILGGGDFTTNLWQRPAASYAAITPTTSTLTADRWAVQSTGNTVTVTKQTGAADTILASGFGASMRINRPSGTDVTDICIGQTIPTKDIARSLGQTVVFSWWGLNGAGMSATSGRVKATIAYATQADSTTAGTLTDAMMKGTATGYVAATSAGGAGTTATITSGVATLSQSATWTRYSVIGVIPTTATQGLVKICYTPIGTGGATDWVELIGLQLENGVAAAPQPGAFARRNLADEANILTSYSWVINEPAASISVAPSGQGASTTTCVLSIPTPNQMRIVPSIAFLGTALGATTWTITHVVTNTVLSTPFLAATTGGSTTNMLNLTATTGATLTAGQTCTLTGATGGNVIVASAEP